MPPLQQGNEVGQKVGLSKGGEGDTGVAGKPHFPSYQVMKNSVLASDLIFERDMLLTTKQTLGQGMA